MYEVTLDGELIYAPGDPELVLLNPKLELADNKSGSFEFDLPSTNPAYNKIKKLVSEIIVKKDGTGIFYGRCLSIDKDFNNMKSVVCEGELAYLLDSIQEPKEFHNYTVRQFLTHLINVHNTQTNNTKKFTVGQTTVNDPNDSLYRYTNWETTLDDIMDKLVDRLGGHIRIRHVGSTRYIDYIEDYDNTNTQVIEFGENLLDYAENMDASEIATRIIPLGARLETSSIEALEEYTTIKSVNNNIPYVESASAVKNFGIITRTVSFDDVTQPSNLKTKAQQYLSDVQYENLCLTCKAVDLNMVDGSVERIKLGDSIRVLSPPHGMDRYFPVTALTIHLDKPEDNTITLGTNIKAGLSERSTSENANLIKRINSIPPLSQALSMAKENATALITAATTGHVVTRPNEILIMDTADTATAKKVWRWNMNGLGYSKTGYKGTYGLAMTIDGAIVADYITTGTLNADLIKAGVLKDTTGNMTWNLKTGAITAKKLSIDSTNFTLTTSGYMTAKNATINGTVTAESGDNKVVMGTGRLRISYKNKELGLIGANNMTNTSKCGLTFDLEYTGDYMTWAAQPKADASYDMKWTYARSGVSGFSGDMLNAGCDIDMRNHKLRNVSWPDGGITGTCNFVRIISMNSDGTVAKWSNSNKLQFKNGILISGTFS